MGDMTPHPKAKPGATASRSGAVVRVEVDGAEVFDEARPFTRAEARRLIEAIRRAVRGMRERR